MRLETKNLNHVIAILSDYMTMEEFVRDIFQTGDIIKTDWNGDVFGWTFNFKRRSVSISKDKNGEYTLTIS